MPYFVGAVLLALAITGGVFAYGFVNATTTINATIENSNFADVSVNNTMPAIAWDTWGMYKGSIPTGYLFNVTPGNNYTGDLAVTVALGNADQLAKDYRMFALQLDMIYTQNGSVVDITESSNSSNGNPGTDWVMLTLDNGSVTMFPQGTANAAQMTVQVVRGFFITQIHPFIGWQGSPSPQLFCQVAQR